MFMSTNLTSSALIILESASMFYEQTYFKGFGIIMIGFVGICITCDFHCPYCKPFFFLLSSYEKLSLYG